MSKTLSNVVSVGTLNVVVPVGNLTYKPEMSVKFATSSSVTVEHALTRCEYPMFFTLGNTAFNSDKEL